MYYSSCRDGTGCLAILEWKLSHPVARTSVESGDWLTCSLCLANPSCAVCSNKHGVIISVQRLEIHKSAGAESQWISKMLRGNLLRLTNL